MINLIWGTEVKWCWELGLAVKIGQRTRAANFIVNSSVGQTAGTEEGSNPTKKRAGGERKQLFLCRISEKGQELKRKGKHPAHTTVRLNGQRHLIEGSKPGEKIIRKQNRKDKKQIGAKVWSTGYRKWTFTGSDL
jgi:hypothetical protein